MRFSRSRNNIFGVLKKYSYQAKMEILKNHGELIPTRDTF